MDPDPLATHIPAAAVCPDPIAYSYDALSKLVPDPKVIEVPGTN